jgi:Mrp family chromosome partitioning ATPase
MIRSGAVYQVGERDDKNGSSAHGGSAALTLIPSLDGQTGISYVRFAPRPPFDDRLVFMQERGSETAAAFRLLRQRLIERNDPHIILCTSAGRHEGKSTLAANLAMAYAELGRHRVLLIEASLRVTALGEMFGFLPPKGFASQLAAHRSRPGDPWIVVQIGDAPLYVLAVEPRACPSCARVLAELASFCPMCGTNVTAVGASEGLDGVAFSATIETFRQSFDYLIIDAPPVLGSGEVNLMQDTADAIVFAARRGKTEAHELRRAIDQVAPAPVAAVALVDQ